MNKKIWIDIEEPKTAIMFQSLIKMFKKEGYELLITVRDFDSTQHIMNDSGIEYRGAGKHGGATLFGKLYSYANRVDYLACDVNFFKPDYFVTFSSVAGVRVTFGLDIPSFGFNDEPRNTHVCKLILPLLDNVLIPKCIPIEQYIKLGATPEKTIQYNGIDEMAWILNYNPNPNIFEKHDLKNQNYIIIRSEPTTASYLIDTHKPEETLITKFFPKIFREFPNHKYFLLARSQQQEYFLKKSIGENSNIEITRYLPNMLDLCYYSSLIISGGGTIVRESSLLGVPSIMFFPGETAPQDTFLMKNGFPLEHIRDPKDITKRAIELLNKPIINRNNFKENISKFENPNKICFNFIKKKLEL